jgi:hypothetical protein
MYCRFYLLVNPSILYLLSGLSQQPSPSASLRSFPPLRPSTSKWDLFTFVCLVAQLCQSCDTYLTTIGVSPPTLCAFFRYNSLANVTLTTLHRFLYVLYIMMDANFRLRNRAHKNDARDPRLSPGWSYYVNSAPFEEFLKTHINEEDVRLILIPLLNALEPLLHS